VHYATTRIRATLGHHKNTIVKDVYLATDNDGGNGNAIFAVSFNKHEKRVSFTNYELQIALWIINQKLHL